MPHAHRHDVKLRTIFLLRAFTLCALIACGHLATTALSAQETPQSSIIPGLADNEDEPIDISADSLVVNQEERVAIFEGNVHVVQGTVRLNSQKLMVFYSQTEQDKNPGAGTSPEAITRIDALGDVVVIAEEETVRSARAVYDVQARTILMQKDVILTQGESVLRGDKLTMDLETGKSVLSSNETPDGRVTGRFVPGSGDPAQ